MDGWNMTWTMTLSLARCLCAMESTAWLTSARIVVSSYKDKVADRLLIVLLKMIVSADCATAHSVVSKILLLVAVG